MPTVRAILASARAKLALVPTSRDEASMFLEHTTNQPFEKSPIAGRDGFEIVSREPLLTSGFGHTNVKEGQFKMVVRLGHAPFAKDAEREDNLQQDVARIADIFEAYSFPIGVMAVFYESAVTDKRSDPNWWITEITFRVHYLNQVQDVELWTALGDSLSVYPLLSGGWPQALNDMGQELRSWSSLATSGYSLAQTLASLTPIIGSGVHGVSILAGFNDIWTNNGGGTVDGEDAFNDAKLIYDAAVAGGLQILAISIPPTKNATSAQNDIWTNQFNALAAPYVQSVGGLWIDWYAAVDDGDGSTQAAYTSDGIHPNTAGKDLLAGLVRDALLTL